jgi:hypothetical protein
VEHLIAYKDKGRNALPLWLSLQGVFDPETRYRYSDLRTIAKLERRFTRRAINFEEFE